MTLTKQTICDKIEIIKADNHYIIQIREAIQVLEDGKLLSQSFHRYSLAPDADVSAITDSTVKAQFETIMTDEIKANYKTFLEAQNAKLNPLV